MKKINFNDIYDTIIIGGGPTGMTAATYLRSENRKILVIDKNEKCGGQLKYIFNIKNYPACENISGEKLANKMFKQMIHRGAQYLKAEVDDVVRLENNYFKIILKDTDKTLTTRSVLLAAGLDYKKPDNIENIEQYETKGLYYHVYNDNEMYKDNVVAIIGNSDMAFHYALLLKDKCKDVIIVIDKENPEVKSKQLTDNFEKANTDNIFMITNTKLLKIEADDSRIKSLILEQQNNNEKIRLEVDKVIIAIDQKPNISKIANSVGLQINESGYASASDLNGFYVSGDCAIKKYRQVAIAVGLGAYKALDILEYLRKLDDKKIKETE